MRPVPRTALVGLALLAAALPFVAAGGARADGPARHETLRDFQPTGKWVWEPTAPSDQPVLVYFSARAAAYVLRGAGLASPFLLRNGSNLVESFPEAAILPGEKDAFDLKADVATKELGRYEIDLKTKSLRVAVDGLKGRLLPASAMLGWKKAAALLEHVPEYARDAKAYTPDAATLASLRGCSGEVRVFVYFGTWCQTCGTVMGHILRVEQELASGCKPGDKPAFQFDYYGMPPPPETWKDPEAEKYQLDVLPTGLVYVNGTLCRRIVGGDWASPERVLRDAMGPR